MSQVGWDLFVSWSLYWQAKTLRFTASGWAQGGTRRRICFFSSFAFRETQGKSKKRTMNFGNSGGGGLYDTIMEYSFVRIPGIILFFSTLLFLSFFVLLLLLVQGLGYLTLHNAALQIFTFAFNDQFGGGLQPGVGSPEVDCSV